MAWSLRRVGPSADRAQRQRRDRSRDPVRRSGNARFEDLDGQGTDTYEGAFATPDQIILAGHYDDGTFGYSAIDVYELGLYTRALTAGERARLDDYLRNKYGL